MSRRRRARRRVCLRGGARVLPLLALACALAGCGRAGSAPARAGDGELSRDLAASAGLERVSREVERARFCTREQLAFLEDCRRRYPASSRARAALESAYVLRTDWHGGAALYEEIPAAERTARDRRSLAGFYLKLGRFGEALAELEPLREADPADPLLANLAAQAHFARGDLARAAAALEAAWPALEARRDVEALRLRGLIHLDRGELDEARRWLARCVELQPDYAAGQYALSRCLAASGDLAGAEAAAARYRAIERGAQEEAEARMRMSALAQELRRTREAGDAAEFERVVEQMLALADPALREQLARAREEARREFEARAR